MKRKALIVFIGLCLSLAMGLSIVACGKQENTATEETVPATVESTQTETIEEIKETTETTEQSETEFIEESSGTTRTDYPDSNPEHQKAWDNFCENWNESDYGTTTAGKCENDFPYYGDTGYDPKGTILQYRTTDKGYTVMYDTATGRVYYTGMTLPTGDAWDDTTSGGVISQYIIDNNLTGMYDLTYAQFQELLGTYAGD